MNGHNKTLEKLLYQQKVIEKRKSNKVSRSGQNSFYVESWPGQTSFFRYLGWDRTVCMDLFLGNLFRDLCIGDRIFWTKIKSLDKYQAPLFYILHFPLRYLKMATKNHIKTVPSRPRCHINMSLDYPFKL